MKALLSLLLVLTVLQGMSQKKNKADSRDAQIDTLTQTNAVLSKQVDSISKDRALYYGLYTVLKEKVLLSDFDPARFDKILDSLRTTRDSANALTLAPMASLKDSLAMVTMENRELKQRLDSSSHITADKSKLVAELKDLKSLLDAKLITQAEFDQKKKLVMDKWQ
jgi:hypothetical protein